MAKAARGVTMLAPGVWQSQYFDHNRKRKRTRHKTQKEAMEFVAERRKAVKTVREHPELEQKYFGKVVQSMTLGEFMKTLVPELERNRSWTDQKRFMRRWDQMIGDVSLNILIKEAKTHAGRRREAMLSDGLAPATINHEMKFLRMVFGKAVEQDFLPKNPLLGFKLLPENNVKTRYLLIPEEIRLEAVMEPADFDLVAFAIDTGLRQAEQFELPWRCVTFEDGGWIRIERTKTDKARSVPLTARALEILRRIHASRRSHFVFASSTGSAMLAHNFYRRKYQPALETAEILDADWHCLRHTCASRLALAGKSLLEIAQILGHSSTKTTERYAHLLPQAARSTIQALDDQHQQSRLRLVR